MYCVHIYGLHVYCALVDLNVSGSPGVSSTPGLTPSTQVVCVCARAYTSTHPPTTLPPAKIEKYTRQDPYLYSCQNIASHTSTKRYPSQPPTSNPPLHMHAGVRQIPVIHTHVVERLDCTNKQNKPTQVHMYTHTRVYIQVYTFIYTDTHIYIYIHMHMPTYMQTCTHIYICTYMHTYTQINLSKDASTP